MSKPKVIVLILSYNGKKLLDDSISSYLANEYPSFEVVIIDNGSNDGTKVYVENKFPDVIVIRIEKNRGYSGGFNFGLDYAFNQKKADYVLVTNNDVKADKNVISSLVEVAETDDKIGFVTGKVYYYDNPAVLQTTGKSEDPIRWNGPDIGVGMVDNGQFDVIKEIPFADDIFMLVSQNLYAEIGGYDETFFLQSEQFDWQVRAKGKFKIFYTYKAKIFHKESMTIGKTSALKEYYNSRNPMLVILIHREAKFFRRYFWNHFIYRITYFSIKSFIKFEFKKALYIWLGFISGLFWGLKNKKFTVRHFI
ncbi:MAG: glycosyltransferase family 2 protein [Bacteroidia bacterium]|nr:glycosyltransferase family 2 protein [Bacteroidia bacterium]